MQPSSDAADRAMMARCIELSRIAAGKGEYPFGTVIALDGTIVAEAINSSFRDGDVTRHAEVIALSQAQKTIGHKAISRCTLYSNVEPCAMCAFCIRAAWVGRVVYALESPLMGGLSKWNILRDASISDTLPQSFDAVPEVVSGVLVGEAQQAWRDWNPLISAMIRLRGLLTAPGVQPDQVHVKPAHGRSLWHHLQIWLTRSEPSRAGTTETE